MVLSDYHTILNSIRPLSIICTWKTTRPSFLDSTRIYIQATERVPLLIVLELLPDRKIPADTLYSAFQLQISA